MDEWDTYHMNQIAALFGEYVGSPGGAAAHLTTHSAVILSFQQRRIPRRRWRRPSQRGSFSSKNQPGLSEISLSDWCKLLKTCGLLHIENTSAVLSHSFHHRAVINLKPHRTKDLWALDSPNWLSSVSENAWRAELRQTGNVRKETGIKDDPNKRLVIYLAKIKVKKKKKTHGTWKVQTKTFGKSLGILGFCCPGCACACPGMEAKRPPEMAVTGPRASKR